MNIIALTVLILIMASLIALLALLAYDGHPGGLAVAGAGAVIGPAVIWLTSRNRRT
jgi:hypothetical protein